MICRNGAHDWYFCKHLHITGCWRRLSEARFVLQEVTWGFPGNSDAVVYKLLGTRNQFCGRQFFHKRGRGWGWFWDVSSVLHLLCSLFLLVLYQLHLRSSGIRSQRLGTPALFFIYFFFFSFFGGDPCFREHAIPDTDNLCGASW